jgi:hypothetical protein
MIHMRMSQQHEINRRKLLYTQPRPALSSQQNQPLGKDRIDQYLPSARL